MRIRRSIAAVVVTLIWAWGSPALSATATPPNQCSADNLNGDARLGPGCDFPFPTRSASSSPATTGSPASAPTTSSPPTGTPPPSGARAAGVTHRLTASSSGPTASPSKRPSPCVSASRSTATGASSGAFLAPFGILYSQRAIPPQSLDNTTTPATCNYRAYKVLKEFRVDGGPIAPVFGQPGKGLQYMLQGALVPGAPAQLNVLWLVDHGYLQRLN